MIPFMFSLGEADLNKMEICVEQLAVVMQCSETKQKQTVKRVSMWVDTVNRDFLFFRENRRCDFKFLSTVVC